MLGKVNIKKLIADSVLSPLGALHYSTCLGALEKAFLVRKFGINTNAHGSTKNTVHGFLWDLSHERGVKFTTRVMLGPSADFIHVTTFHLHSIHSR